MTKPAATIIRETINDLISINYTTGFNDNVLIRVCDNLAEHGYDYSDLWSKACVISCANPTKRQHIIDVWLDGDATTFDKWVDLDETSRNGGFKMPEWGTKGT